MRQDVGPDWMFETVASVMALQDLGPRFNGLTGDQKVALAGDALAVWKEAFRPTGTTADEAHIPAAVKELVRRIGGPGNLEVYAEGLVRQAQRGVGAL